MIPDVDDIHPMFAALYREIRRPEFSERHGPGRGHQQAILDKLLEWASRNEPTTETVDDALRDAIQEFIKDSPRRSALHALANRMRVGVIAAEMIRETDSDVLDLADAIQICLITLIMTKENALDAFAGIFERASLRIRAKERADQRHAPAKKWFEEAWDSYCRGNPKEESVRAFLQRFLNHNRSEPSIPKLRAFQKYFTERARAKGIRPRRGRRPNSAKS